MSANPGDIESLRRALSRLETSTGALTRAYAALTAEAARLSTELEESHRFLSGVMESLPCAVVVTGARGAVELVNAEARELGADDAALVRAAAAELSGRPGGARLLRAVGGRTLSLAVRPAPGGRTIMTAEDVTELERLRAGARRAERLAGAGGLAAAMAHEIRNPLGGMEIFISLLRRELADDADTLAMLGHVASGAQAINHVITNVLMFTGEPRPAFERFDARRLLREIFEFAHGIFEKNRVAPRLAPPEGPLFVHADPGMVRQVILNMIHNAVAAQPEGGFFEASVTQTGGRVEFRFADGGPGVGADIRERIFDPFFTTKDSGAGLGLSIVNQIARAHGGFADLVDSAGPGAVFVFSIPSRGE
ncbi:MAG: HAMP domain-containing histidine kinase [Nitrospinae bacterium]|nr:HAMP domain-containing histidine kinase [Nitrospinota bacterium]